MRWSGTCAGVVVLVAALARAPASADPPSEGRVWVEHRVSPGERLSEIAARYAVDEDSIARENHIVPGGLRAGSTLRVFAKRQPKQIEYIVRFGDNWNSIAERHGVARTDLRRWNPEVPRTFEAGTLLSIWVEGDFEPTLPTGGLGVDASRDGLPLRPIDDGAQSAGRPDHGRLLHGVQLPDNPALYRIRRPDFAYGTTHALTHLQLAIARFRRDSGYAFPLVISDISQRRGGRYGTHDSHQSGRDVDLWLPLVAKLHAEAPDDAPDFTHLASDGLKDVDWPATWALVKALIQTGEVQYIFLSRARQRELYRAARADGMSVQALGEVIQYPRSAQTAIVRHAPKHTRHMHIRFRCADAERRCR